MARQRPGRAAPSRPTVAKPAPALQQTRPATTAAAPPQQHAQAPPAQAAPSQGPGLLGQMASTAAGVAIGSSIGHAIGGLFSGGSSAPAAPEQSQQVQATSQQQNYASEQGNCAPAVQQFTKCMDDHQGNMQICNWYLEQLKACQSAASNY
ncbi:hypothetical protein SODALDRAFT_325223 [Sodiomyces alkalinus F11]|uniref:CHCH domain-containing protein n=1 Tax=Sodiomyces alkalinus (strain CBS 110278 / VKM F-3762 / F11) TaxID=1314773 RepID=A0A3N2PT47_SODAK|nr:hypothetical protein SODALDRAFT_325223 [Sodiomyces alkalinus F11]ROT37670.1 hypothetical protein SODALDRAFT_325223 [Sodiomyces alkalinus F11]